jgi:hypothetical protein
MCFARISEKAEIISLYSTNLAVFITEPKSCLLRGMDWVFKSDRVSSLKVRPAQFQRTILSYGRFFTQNITLLKNFMFNNTI